MTSQAPTLSAYIRLMRLHKPVGIWLLLWPCWWSVALLSDGWPSPALLMLFAVGAVVMRSAGCIINDMWDRDLDAQVERTKDRPLASGELTIPQALPLLALLLCIGFIVALSLGERVMLWAALSLPLVVTYPLMKRITWWPQAFLGLTFNWGALLGSIAVTGEVQSEAWWLYAGGVFWTLGYDTLYAAQDIAYDAKYGARSSALRLEKHIKPAVAIFYFIAQICWLMAALSIMPESGFIYLILFALLWHMLWQLKRAQTKDPTTCGDAFRSNAWLGAVVFVLCLLANLA